MIKKLIVALIISVLCIQTSSAQKFDPEKFEELRVQANKSSEGLSSRGTRLVRKLSESYQNGRHQDVVDAADAADITKFNNTELLTVYQLVASAYQGLNDMPKSLEYFERIVELPPTSATVYSNFLLITGQMQFSEGNAAKALEYIDLHLTYNRTPKFSTFQSAVAAAIQLKDFDRAHQYINIAEEIVNNDPAKADDYAAGITNLREIIEGTISGKLTEPDSGPDYKLVKGAKPQYPAFALERKIEGFVLVRFDIDIEGRPVNIDVVESSHRSFEKSARDAVANYQLEILSNANEDGFLMDQMTRIEFRLADITN